MSTASVAGGPEFNERITAAHLVWQRKIRKSSPKSPTSITNDGRRPAGDASSLAYYVQTAYRLPSIGRPWKPYYRFEHIDIA